jgi:sterol 3beta-glucosyltransferase
MRIVLSTVGSTGDVQPLLALAMGLRARGHESTVAIPADATGRAAALGLRAVAIGPRLSEQERRAIGQSINDVPDTAHQAGRFLEALLPSLPAMYDTLLELSADADVLIGSPFHPACRMVHERLGVPYASLHLSQFGDLGSPTLRRMTADLINPYRERAALPALRDPLGVDGNSPQLALYAVSPLLLRRPPHWPSHHHVTGFLFLDEPAYQPDPALEAFLHGEPPIVITFGSTVHANAAAVTTRLVEAIALTGRPALIQEGWSGLGSTSLPSSVRIVSYVPHAWLLPRACVVVHHGGAGTTAAAFRAGVPTVIVPHTLDQPIWGALARAVGSASAVIPIADLTARRLADAIHQACEPAWRARAAAFGLRMRDEDGVATACDLIEQLAARRADASAGARARPAAASRSTC